MGKGPKSIILEIGKQATIGAFLMLRYSDMLTSFGVEKWSTKKDLIIWPL